MKAESKIAKKTVILYVLNVLKAYSSKDNPVSQTAISNYLNDINVHCDRKTVGRNITYLQQFGYPIEKISGKGYYLDKDKLSESKNKLII